jgi:CCR4-NOT transcription complex subunit 7/8
MYAPDSIELLQASGLNFKRHEEQGIDPEYFGELLISSGLVLLEDVKWVSFHSGYDFGYILKMVTLVNMPATETEFFDLLKIWFPCIYDIKFLMRSCKSLRGGLNEVAKDLNVRLRKLTHHLSARCSCPLNVLLLASLVSFFLFTHRSLVRERSTKRARTRF